MKRIKFFSIALLALSVSACVSHQVKPDWVDNPGNGTSASAVTHIMGKHQQEELAITRARERMAARYGVEVSSVHQTHEVVLNDKMYVTSDKKIKQVIKSQTIKTRVREKWNNKTTDEIWVWLYPIQ